MNSETYAVVALTMMAQNYFGLFHRDLRALGFQ